MRSLISTAPESIRTELRGLNVFHLLERASAYRPGAERDIVSLTKFTLRMLARRAITLEEEISEIDAILKPLVIETARGSWGLWASAPTPPRHCWSPPATIPSACATKLPSLICAVPHRSKPAVASRSGTGSTAAVTAKPTRLCGTS